MRVFSKEVISLTVVQYAILVFFVKEEKSP